MRVKSLAPFSKEEISSSSTFASCCSPTKTSPALSTEFPRVHPTSSTNFSFTNLPSSWVEETIRVAI